MRFAEANSWYVLCSRMILLPREVGGTLDMGSSAEVRTRGVVS